MTASMRLRLLSAAENARFSELVDAGVQEDNPDIATLRGSASGVDVGEIPAPRAVANKLELAQALRQQADTVFRSHPTLGEDPTFWNALMLHWMPFVLGKGGEQRSEYLVFKTGGRDRYRHRLAGPYYLLKRFDRSPAVANLLKALRHDAHGDLLEQLLGRQYVFFSDAAWGTAARMYLDDTGAIRRGALGRGPGSVRRFGVVLQQLAVTYDTSLIDEPTLERLLPLEFERFRNR